MNVMAQVQVNQAEQAELQKIEQLKRKGHKFIRARSNVGPIRLHSIDASIATPRYDAATGQTDWTPGIGQRALEFRSDPFTGDLVADILDTENNRFFLSRHLYLGIEIMDDKIASEIAALAKVPYRVELTEEEEIDRQILALQKRKEEGIAKKRQTLENGIQNDAMADMGSEVIPTAVQPSVNAVTPNPIQKTRDVKKITRRKKFISNVVKPTSPPKLHNAPQPEPEDAAPELAESQVD